MINTQIAYLSNIYSISSNMKHKKENNYAKETVNQTIEPKIDNE